VAKLRVRLGEQVQVESAAGRPLRLTTRHEGLLLGALALANGQELNRKRLAHLLWPDTEPDAAVVNLRRRLSDLRRLVGPYLEADRTCISLAPLAVEAIVDPSSALSRRHRAAASREDASSSAGSSFSTSDADQAASQSRSLSVVQRGRREA
jgi:DNA-binding SARP family transcriptional activator